jgi:hypothetical protein
VINKLRDELVKKFREIDYPSFNELKSTLDRSLWVLFVAKEKLCKEKLTAKDIANVIAEVMEFNVSEVSVKQSLRRAGDMIRVCKKSNKTFYEIMMPGKEHILTKMNNAKIKVYYFEPGKPFTGKRMLSKEILANLEGDLKIVDPYFGIRTLDILGDVKNKQIKFLTSLNKLEREIREQTIRAIHEFKQENKNFEIKNYTNQDIHDRYIISMDSIILLGHSIKDLGKKESIVVILPKKVCPDFFGLLNEKFNDKWDKAQAL